MNPFYFFLHYYVFCRALFLQGNISGILGGQERPREPCFGFQSLQGAVGPAAPCPLHVVAGAAGCELPSLAQRLHFFPISNALLTATRGGTGCLHGKRESKYGKIFGQGNSLGKIPESFPKTGHRGLFCPALGMHAGCMPLADLVLLTQNPNTNLERERAAPTPCLLPSLHFTPAGTERGPSAPPNVLGWRRQMGQSPKRWDSPTKATALLRDRGLGTSLPPSAPSQAPG